MVSDPSFFHSLVLKVVVSCSLWTTSYISPTYGWLAATPDPGVSDYSLMTASATCALIGSACSAYESPCVPIRLLARRVSKHSSSSVSCLSGPGRRSAFSLLCTSHFPIGVSELFFDLIVEVLFCKFFLRPGESASSCGADFLPVHRRWVRNPCRIICSSPSGFYLPGLPFELAALFFLAGGCLMAWQSILETESLFSSSCLFFFG